MVFFIRHEAKKLSLIRTQNVRIIIHGYETSKQKINMD